MIGWLVYQRLTCCFIIRASLCNSLAFYLGLDGKPDSQKLEKLNYLSNYSIIAAMNDNSVVDWNGAEIGICCGQLFVCAFQVLFFW